MAYKFSLQELIDYRGGGPVLSVYLGARANERSPEALRLSLKALLRDFEPEAVRDVEVVRRYLEQQPGTPGRSLAIFSAADHGFFRALGFPVEIRSRARRLDRPYVKPLADLFDSYGHMGVALASQEQARFFHFHLGELEELDGVHGSPVKRVKRGGASTFPGRRGGIAGRSRKAEGDAARNVKEAAAAAARTFGNLHVRRLIVGGPHDGVVLFLESLPKTWSSLVLGTFAADMQETNEEIRQQAMQLAQRAELDREAHLVSSVVTAAAKGKGGVVGLEQTLSGVHAGHVMTLVASDGFRAPGFRCRGCGYLTTRRLPQCPFCGNTFTEIEDSVELAVQRVLQNGGEVHIVHANPELEKAGSIGGLLRF
jgi:peptide chain release factor subunit 1